MIDNTFPLKLHEHLDKIAPIRSVKIVKVDDRSTWRIVFKDEATEQQKADAQAAMLIFAPPPDDPEDIESSVFGKRERAILIAAALLGGATPAQAKAAAKARFKQALELA
jgi:hypothetical protein